MNRDVTTRLLFVVLLLVVAWSAFRIIAPFLAGLTWAAVLVVTFRPFHRRLGYTLGGRKWAATTIVTLLVAAFVVVPVTMAAFQAAQAGMNIFASVQQWYQGGGSSTELTDRWPWVADLVERGKQLVGLASVDLRAVTMEVLQRVVQLVTDKGPALVGGVLGLTFSFLVMIVGIPLLFSNGEAFTAALADALPIPSDEARRILIDVGDMTRSVFVSVGLTAAAQAALGGLGFVFLGVPRPASLTALMFFMALVPGGVALVWAPVALWLAMTGQTWSAIAMVVWGAGVVGTIDNVLRPLLAGRGVKLGGAALFFGMFGGMIAFGLVGLFLGPIVLYAGRELVAILRRDIYAEPAATLGSGLETSPFS